MSPRTSGSIPKIKQDSLHSFKTSPSSSSFYKIDEKTKRRTELRCKELFIIINGKEEEIRNETFGNFSLELFLLQRRFNGLSCREKSQYKGLRIAGNYGNCNRR